MFCGAPARHTLPPASRFGTPTFHVIICQLAAGAHSQCDSSSGVAVAASSRPEQVSVRRRRRHPGQQQQRSSAAVVVA